MKLDLNKVVFLFIINISFILKEFASKNTQNEKDRNSNKLEIIPDIDLKNFDIREKFYECYNPGYDADLIERTACYQNWFVQFTILLTDKICILKNRNSKRILSPMNLISCIRLHEDLKLTCSNSAQFYENYNTTLDTVKKTIQFFNLNGTQYKDENDYAIIKETKSFKECGSYASSIEFKIDQNVIELDELNDDDFKKIKYNLYMEGPILAVLQTNIDIYTSTEPIYSPQPKTQLDGMKFLRVIGWQTINDKQFWIFTFTKGNDWEIMNYKLIASKDYGLKFIDLNLQ